MKLSFSSRGSFDKTFNFFHRMKNKDYLTVLDALGKEGVLALSSATPVESGKTSRSWNYEIEDDGRTSRIIWTNSSLTKNGDSIAIMLQYGHGTGTGGYVQGIDYINPVIQPIFDRIAETAWRVVTQS